MGLAHSRKRINFMRNVLNELCLSGIAVASHREIKLGTGYNGVCACGAAGGGRGEPARMAAPMREGAPAGGARPAPHAHPANFEYDDNEWDIGIGDLIIDLDADIEKTDEAGGMAARAEPDAQRTALKMKIKRTKPGTKSSEAKHEIVKSNEMNGEPKPPAAAAAPPPAAKRGSGGHRRDKAREKHHHPHAPHAPHPPHDVNGVARVPPPPNAPGPPAPPAPAASAPVQPAPATPAKPEARPARAQARAQAGGARPAARGARARPAEPRRHGSRARADPAPRQPRAAHAAHAARAPHPLAGRQTGTGRLSAGGTPRATAGKETENRTQDLDLDWPAALPRTRAISITGPSLSITAIAR
ncbi:unnamed protein product, partial [Iphiclides podalirius]